MFNISVYDIISFGFVLAVWGGYTYYSDHSAAAKTNLISGMAAQRRLWIRGMLRRDNRMVDIQIVNAMMRSGRFFASTAILIIAGLLAVLGSTDRVIALAMELPVSLDVSRASWEMKLLLLMFVFVYAFFKFVWSNRQYNYCAIMIGAAPAASTIPEGDDTPCANIAALATLAAKHANRGIRAYYFGLAMLGWFIHPLFMLAAVVLVVLVLYRREFRSNTMRLTRPENESA